MSDEAEPQAPDPFQAFPPQWQQAVTGLAFLGQMTDEFRFCGHTYVLKTLKPHEKITIGLVLQPMRNTLYEELAWRTAHIAVALTEIDGHTDFCPPVTRNLEDFIRARIAFIGNEIDGWEPPLIQYIWDKYARLEFLAAQMVTELDSLLQAEQPTSPPWLDSLIEQGPSSEPMDSDTPPFTSSSFDS